MSKAKSVLLPYMLHGSPNTSLVLAANIDDENKFPDSEPDSGYGELEHISQMITDLQSTVSKLFRT